MWDNRPGINGVLERKDAEIERLRAALQRYGLHTWDCTYNDSRGDKPCDCGWSALDEA